MSICRCVPDVYGHMSYCPKTEPRIALMDVEPDEVDPMHAAGGRARDWHNHYCKWCDEYWGHNVGDEGCTDGRDQDCPAHDERSELR